MDYVFVGKNNNGIRDKNEIGAKDVVISEPAETVVTHTDGSYRLKSLISTSLSLSVQLMDLLQSLTPAYRQAG